MNAFKFNFSGTEEEPKPKDKTIDNINWHDSEEILPGKQSKNLDENVRHAQMFTCGQVEIGHVLAKETVANFSGQSLNNVYSADKEHSDLVPGKYEGGLKIWECTQDLIQYLDENAVNIKMKGSSVLDLGCGAGILGIYAFMNGSQVTFQDYNREVIECITIPNVLLNVEEEDRDNEITKCKFYSGDWGSFNKKLSHIQLYDIILTSETIYNPSNYEKLIDLFLQRLSSDGAAYVAAKTYYFGVGGGTRQFEECIATNGRLQSEVCWKSLGGIQREILKVTRKS